MQKDELEARSGKLTLLVPHTVPVHRLPGLLLAFKEVALTREYKLALLISSVRERRGLVLNSLPLHQEPFVDTCSSKHKKVSLVLQYSYVATRTIDGYSCSTCSCADKMFQQKSTTHRSSKLVHAYVFSSSSNHTQASRSRWFVGSSRSSMKGRMKRALKGEGR